MPCLDLCVLCVYFHVIALDPCLHICLYAWTHVLPCLCAKFLHVYMYVSMPICLHLCFHMLGPDLDPIVFVIVHTPWPIPKGLDHTFCTSMFAYFYALCLC